VTGYRFPLSSRPARFARRYIDTEGELTRHTHHLSPVQQQSRHLISQVLLPLILSKDDSIAIHDSRHLGNSSYLVQPSSLFRIPIST
jgi:hypothetical protein